MKLFVYKTLFIFVSIFIIFQLTIGLKIKQFEKKLKNLNLKKISKMLKIRLEKNLEAE